MRFVFEFSDSDFEGKGWERPSTTFWFEVDLPFEFGSEEWVDWDDDYLLEQASDLESYGVHDFMASGLPGGGWDEFGYNSYEVQHDKWETLMEQWHGWFVEQGFNPGKINSLHTNAYALKFMPHTIRED